jgi:hypothetical protein
MKNGVVFGVVAAVAGVVTGLPDPRGLRSHPMRPEGGAPGLYAQYDWPSRTPLPIVAPHRAVLHGSVASVATSGHTAGSTDPQVLFDVSKDMQVDHTVSPCRDSFLPCFHTCPLPIITHGTARAPHSPQCHTQPAQPMIYLSPPSAPQHVSTRSHTQPMHVHANAATPLSNADTTFFLFFCVCGHPLPSSGW